MQNIDVLIKNTEKNLKDILDLSIKYSTNERAVVIYDTQYGLTDILTSGYRATLPDATFINFDTCDKQEILDIFDTLKPNDLVVLIQSTNFLLNEFRIRLRLFEKQIKVIEHMHLVRNTPDVWDVYINALSFDKKWYHNTGHKLKNVLENTKELKINASGSQLVVHDGLEVPKLNIGDYEGMNNIGGTFPIGEVFTEAKDLSKMNGSAYIYAFADKDFKINMHEPFRIDIKNGIVVGYGDNTPESFIEILELIKTYERPMIREVGFGLNRAITKERYLQDITAFERIFGMHLSLGEKHSVYKKDDITTHKTKFHVDIFPVVEEIYSNDSLIFQNGQYIDFSA
jgi:hypothetical protein